LTPKGKKRNSMTAAQRAKARAAKYNGKPASSYTYNPRTNGVRVKKKGKKS